MSTNEPPIDRPTPRADSRRNEALKELRWRVSDPRIKIGRGTYGGPEFVLYSADDRVEIGRYCSISGRVTILAGGEHYHRWTTTFPFRWYHGEDPGADVPDPKEVRFVDGYTKGPTMIGSDVWIGYGATILAGVRVGDGAVIGASAVVASDVAPYSIMVGNPARFLRKRFEDAVIDRLLNLRWWEWRPDVIHQYQHYLCGSPLEFLARIDGLTSLELDSYRERGPLVDDLPPPVEPPAREHLLRRLARQVAPPIVSSAFSAVYRSWASGRGRGRRDLACRRGT